MKGRDRDVRKPPLAIKSLVGGAQTGRTRDANVPPPVPFVVSVERVLLYQQKEGAPC